MNELMSSLGIVVFLLIGPALGFGAGYVLSHHRAARALARLRSLVPSPGLLRRAAGACRTTTRYDEANELDDLAARIEMAGEGEE